MTDTHAQGKEGRNPNEDWTRTDQRDSGFPRLCYLPASFLRWTRVGCGAEWCGVPYVGRLVFCEWANCKAGAGRWARVQTWGTGVGRLTRAVETGGARGVFCEGTEDVRSCELEMAWRDWGIRTRAGDGCNVEETFLLDVLLSRCCLSRGVCAVASITVTIAPYPGT